MEINKLIDGYLKRNDWRIKRNSNAPYSFGGLNKFITEEVSKEYWLNNVYTEDIRAAHESGEMHIHDLGGLTLYCCGYSLKRVLELGVTGVPNIPKSKPAKHFDAILNQLANLTTIFQNEIMGAVAFSSFDTLLAPYVRADNLTYDEVKQSLQNYIFSINSNSRAGAEPAFSNLTFDLVIPEDLASQPVMIGGKFDWEHDYGEYQEEVDIINKAFCEIMLGGDANGNPFAYPIPTYSITDETEWDNEVLDLVFEMAGKYGYPYFSNYMGSDMKPSDIRSMCCRMGLDLRELRKRNGGLFGSGDSTGSIGNVTINLPRLGYLATDEQDLYNRLDKVLELACKSLEMKRAWLKKNVVGTGLIPAFDTYVGTIDNHFSTVGIVGLNEMCENLCGSGLGFNSIKKVALRVLDHIRDYILRVQQQTGNLYNLEATPAESTCYSLALKDKEYFGDNIIQQGSGDNVYYTNSCHLPVSQVTSMFKLFNNQDDFQVKFTGGTVVHIYVGASITSTQAKHIIKTICTNYKLPYISISPLISSCEDHGFVKSLNGKCPICNKELKFYQRITGYVRPIDNFNNGKLGEFRDRRQL